jgi:hypothetical protein
MATNVTQINAAFPEAPDKHLHVGLGACKLKAAAGDGAAWVSGTYDPAETGVPVVVEQDGGSLRIKQDYKSFFPFGWFSTPPRFDLTLGKAQPYALTIEMGASDNSFELGGLPITRLAVKQGAGKSEINFAAPNPQPLSSINVESGAMALEMTNLANANFAEMKVDGGAAGYKFDFGGTLQRDAHVKITTGMSGVELIIPATTAAKVGAEAVMGGLNLGDGFTWKDGAYWTEAAIKGQTPLLTIETNVSLGELTLRVK